MLCMTYRQKGTLDRDTAVWGRLCGGQKLALAMCGAIEVFGIDSRRIQGQSGTSRRWPLIVAGIRRETAQVNCDVEELGENNLR
jgi:hypothetical protein